MTSAYPLRNAPVFPILGMLTEANAGEEFGLTTITGSGAVISEVAFAYWLMIARFGTGVGLKAFAKATIELIVVFEEVGIVGGETDAVAFAFATTAILGTGATVVVVPAAPLVIDIEGVGDDTDAVALAGVAVIVGDFTRDGATALAVADAIAVTDSETTGAETLADAEAFVVIVIVGVGATDDAVAVATEETESETAGAETDAVALDVVVIEIVGSGATTEAVATAG